MTDNWYDNKDIYEMLQEVRQDISSLRQEMAKAALRRYFYARSACFGAWAVLWMGVGKCRYVLCMKK